MFDIFGISDDITEKVKYPSINNIISFLFNDKLMPIIFITFRVSITVINVIKNDIKITKVVFEDLFLIKNKSNNIIIAELTTKNIIVFILKSLL